ncbi:MAG: NotI family restriction endonuclease [Chloroflexota bacterium]|nr:NotI family restriction endonuclease [Chloroflexota bacterium]
MTDQRVVELFGIPTVASDIDWKKIVKEQYCPYLERACLKVRKSQPDLAIGTCSVNYGVRDPKDILVCPHRMLSSGRIFIDCLHLLRLHEPGNELHRIAQVEIPGGSVDYFLVSVQSGKVVDFVGIELQTLDTTGTVWPQRQRFLQSVGVGDIDENYSNKPFGMNWKMTAKTILVQLHHKIETFEGLGKHLVLIVQDVLFQYMTRQFNFGHIGTAKLGHSLHFHSYTFVKDQNNERKLQLSSRYSTDMQGMSLALGLQAPANIELEAILVKLQNKISSRTLLSM